MVQPLSGDWQFGGPDDVAWLVPRRRRADGAWPFSLPECYPAYCRVILPPAVAGAQQRHDLALVNRLREHTGPQHWWLGYLDTTGLGDDVVFPNAPRVSLYWDWRYVLVKAGPDEALAWRPSEGFGAPWKGALPDLMFPVDRRWLCTTGWDDRETWIGGPAELVRDIAQDPDLGRRTQLASPTTLPGASVDRG